jgi:hypothetical protein
MRTLGFWLLALPAFFLLSGCATSEEWSTWKGHSAHFASKEHMTFSMWNGEGKTVRVNRQDVALAGDQSWWGKAITVDPQQINER